MKFAHMSHIWRKPAMTPGQRYQQLWRELELADSLGFDYGFTVEHHVDPNESLSVSPPMYIAGAAAHTQHMRLGAMGWLVPLYDPLRVVEEVVSLDNLLEVQVGNHLLRLGPEALAGLHGELVSQPE